MGMGFYQNAQNLVAVDRISALPNDLKVSIVSLIPLQEAVATSVLSSQWRYIWTFVTSLNFRHEILFQLRLYTKVRKESELDRYLNWVDSVMKQHRGQTVKLLRVYADINDPKYESSIHTWCRFALEKRVNNFYLVLSKNRVFPKRGGNEFKAVFSAFPGPDQLLDVDRGSALNQLCFKTDILPCVYSCISAFSCLKYPRSLDFRSVTGLTGQVLKCILSHCPLLERLTVVRAIRLDSFKVIGRSIALKYLHIQKHTGPLSIEICDANLVSFIYGGDEINLLLRNVPQLVEVSISSRRLSFGDCISQLEVLRLRGFVLNNEKHVFPTYVNLKHLELVLKERDSFCVLQLASFMKASPYLHKLVLKLARTISRYYEILMEPHRYHERQVEIKQAPKYSHRFLRVVEVAEYHGRISDFEIVRYLIENAVELEELVIHPVRTWYSGEHMRFNMGNKEGAKRTEKWKRKQAIQQLKELVGASHVGQPEEGLFQDAQKLVVVDMISALPNDLLVSILSLLPLKEAASTSVLSTRWRQIWTFVTTLDFQHDSLVQLRLYKRVRIESELDRYLNWVNSVMKQHRGSTVKLLRVYADIKDPKYVSFIHAWGRFALEKRVQNFDLVLSRNRSFPKRVGNEIKAVFSAIPSSHQLLTVDTGSALNHLCSKPDILSCVYVGCFSAFSCLEYLKALDFRSVKGITGQVLECFLCHCPVLERLTVVRALRLGGLKIIGRSIALKYLHIQKHTGLLSIEISDVNLVSFYYGGDEINLLLRNVPQLIEVSISSHRLSFGDSVSQLEVLRLRGFELKNETHVFPTYVNLKHLELGLKERDSFCVLQLASFMRASPCLQSLVLKLARTISQNYDIIMEPHRYHERLVEIKQAPKYSHRFLTVVEVAEYHGRISDFELVRYLIENAVELKQLVIHPVRQWYSREYIRFNMGNKEGVKKAEKWKRKRATLMLKELVPSTVDFICRLQQLLSTVPKSTLALWPMGLKLSRSLSSITWNSQEHC